MRSNQLSYPAIVLIAGAKVMHFLLTPKFFSDFFELFAEKDEKWHNFVLLYMKYALSLQKKDYTSAIKASFIALGLHYLYKRKKRLWQTIIADYYP